MRTPDDQEERCVSCRFFQEDDHDPDQPSKIVGVCRRYAPRPRLTGDEIPTDIKTHTYWPEVGGLAWCGEYDNGNE